MQSIRVWDLPTRIFHWSLVLAVVALIITGQADLTEWHVLFGYFTLSLLLFRLVWGFIGGHWSRFSSFLLSPNKIMRYLRGEGGDAPSLGHNPLGSVSVYAMLALLLLQVLSGMSSSDDVLFSGPLSTYLSNATVEALTFYHQELGKWLILCLVILHIAAIVYYQRKQHALIQAMWSGDKKSDVDLALASRDNRGTRFIALITYFVCLGLTYLLSQL